MFQTYSQLSNVTIVDDALQRSLDGLDQALAAEVPGHERDWALMVGQSLAKVEYALREHREEAPNELLAEVDGTRPSLARKADAVCRDHGAFLEQIRVLRDEVAHAAEAFRPGQAWGAPGEGGVVDFSDIRQRAEQFLAGLRHNKEDETQLVLESINGDIGVGD